MSYQVVANIILTATFQKKENQHEKVINIIQNHLMRAMYEKFFIKSYFDNNLILRMIC